MKLTVFTPAYNRAALLPRLYASICSQGHFDFEWLIVDDGSSDDTEATVKQFVNEGSVSIRYIKKENGGKHRAHNAAAECAGGEWFFCVDSDDWLAPGALNGIFAALENVRGETAGLVAYKSDRRGNLLCQTLPSGASGGIFSLLKSCSGCGEYALLFRTEVLRGLPFPEISGERFVTESVLYDRLELEGYTVSVLDEVLQICEYQPEGLSSNTYRLMAQNPTGYQIYHAQRLDLVRSWKERVGHAVRYQAFYAMSRNETYRYRGKHRFPVELLRLPGLLGAYYYKNKAGSK